MTKINWPWPIIDIAMPTHRHVTTVVDFQIMMWGQFCTLAMVYSLLYRDTPLHWWHGTKMNRVRCEIGWYSHDVLFVFVILSLAVFVLVKLLHCIQSSVWPGEFVDVHIPSYLPLPLLPILLTRAPHPHIKSSSSIWHPETIENVHFALYCNVYSLHRLFW